MKARKSKLDQFAETLLEMERQKKTLADMQSWLRDEGVTISEGQLSKFLSAQRSARQQQSLLDSIVSGARQVKEVEDRFAKNAAPELDSLIKLLRVAILQLATQAQADPELLKLVNSLTLTVMDYVSGQTKAMHKERELRVTEAKFQRETCELFLKWFEDKRAKEIATGGLSYADKLKQLDQLMFPQDQPA